MQRVAFVMKLKDNQVAAYRRRHAEIWPEMLRALRAAGIHNYSIFLHGDQLFAYLEAEDFERMAKTLAADPTNIHWQETMQSLIETTLDPQTDFSPLLPEMFHMD